MPSAVLSTAARATLSASRETAAALGVAQGRLATGKKVNSALDNPAAYFTASALDQRAAGLLAVLDRVPAAAQTLRTAEHGLEAIEKVLATAMAVAQRAFDQPVPQAAAPTTTTTQVPVGHPAVLTAASSYTGSRDFSGLASVAFSLSDGVNSTSVMLNSASLSGIAADLTRVRREDVVAAINAQLASDPTPAGATASLTGNRVTLTSTATGLPARIVLTNAASNSYDIGFGTATAAQTGSGTETFVDVVQTSSSPPPIQPARSALASEFRGLLTQVDRIAADSAYTGVNLLTAGTGNGLRLALNEHSGSESAVLEVGGAGATTESLGLSGLGAQGFQSDDEVRGALRAVAGAVSRVRSDASRYGATVSMVDVRQAFTRTLVGILQRGAAELTHADMNEQQATARSLSTRQLLAQTSLALTTQAERSALALLA